MPKTMVETSVSTCKDDKNGDDKFLEMFLDNTFSFYLDIECHFFVKDQFFVRHYVCIPVSFDRKVLNTLTSLPSSYVVSLIKKHEPHLFIPDNMESDILSTLYFNVECVVGGI